MSPLHEQRRRQNVRLALILGALALAVLLSSVPVWRLVLATVGG